MWAHWLVRTSILEELQLRAAPFAKWRSFFEHTPRMLNFDASHILTRPRSRARSDGGLGGAKGLPIEELI